MARGSGGWSKPDEKTSLKSNAPIAQLYNMNDDPSEEKNLYKTHPEIVKTLFKALSDIVFQGRSTAGLTSKNDFSDIDLWKSEKENPQL